MPATISCVFIHGNSQAVRIPQEFRLTTNRVEIFRNADGDLVLHPVHADRGAALLDALKGFDDEFVALLEAGQRQRINWNLTPISPETESAPLGTLPNSPTNAGVGTTQPTTGRTVSVADPLH